MKVWRCFVQWWWLRRKSGLRRPRAFIPGLHPGNNEPNHKINVARHSARCVPLFSAQCVCPSDAERRLQFVLHRNDEPFSPIVIAPLQHVEHYTSALSRRNICFPPTNEVQTQREHDT